MFVMEVTEVIKWFLAKPPCFPQANKEMLLPEPNQTQLKVRYVCCSYTTTVKLFWEQ